MCLNLEAKYFHMGEVPVSHYANECIMTNIILPNAFMQSDLLGIWIQRVFIPMPTLDESLM